jgi:polysaccharide pyruvyl transferase WcaK-like protein
LKTDSNKRKKISVFGNFGSGNLGNESTFQAVLQNIRKYLPDADVDCICAGPEAIAATYNITAIPMHPLFVKSELLLNNFISKMFRKLFIGIPLEIFRWFKAFKTLRNRDMLIVPGTQFLSDNLSGPFGCPYIAFKWAVASKIMRCNLVFLSVGVGPLSHPLSRFFVKSALSFADYRSYRDDISRQYLLDIGYASTNDPVYPDLAFSLLLPAELRKPRKIGEPVIAMGVLDYQGQFGPRRPQAPTEVIYSRYLKKVSSFVAWLVENFYTVRFVIGDTACDPTVAKDLITSLNDLKINFEKHQIINEPIESVEQLISHLSLSDIVVSPRFHNVVLGLLLNRPVISLSYHQKFSALMVNYGLNKYILNIDNLDIDTFIRTILDLNKNIDKVKPRIEHKVEEFRKALEYQYRYIFNKLIFD